MQKRLSTLFLIASTAALLGGCDGMETSTSNAAVSSAAVSKSSTATAPRPVRSAADLKKSNVAARGDKGQTTASMLEGAKPAGGTKEEGDPQAERKSLNLVGLDQTQVVKILGPPMSETEKAPGKVWRYWNSRCTVDVSMYLDVHSRAYRVLAYEVTNHDYSAGGTGCLAELPKSNVQPASFGGH